MPSLWKLKNYYRRTVLLQKYYLPEETIASRKAESEGTFLNEARLWYTGVFSAEGRRNAVRPHDDMHTLIRGEFLDYLAEFQSDFKFKKTEKLYHYFVSQR